MTQATFIGGFAIIAVAALAESCAPTLKDNVGCERIQIISDDLTVAEAERYCRYAAAERRKVEEFWGATWSEPIRVHVSRSYRISRALVPARFGNRGFMEMPLRGVRANTGPLLHEIVHIYAPNDNRFLAEGLAVYLHFMLGGNPAFPNFGEDLHRLAARHLPAEGSLDSLNSVRTPQPLSAVMQDEAAYTVAGSFVAFLIEGYGLASFRNLYGTENYQRVYGKSLISLEREWRLSLQMK